MVLIVVSLSSLVLFGTDALINWKLTLIVREIPTTWYELVDADRAGSIVGSALIF